MGYASSAGRTRRPQATAGALWVTFKWILWVNSSVKTHQVPNITTHKVNPDFCVLWRTIFTKAGNSQNWETAHICLRVLRFLPFLENCQTQCGVFLHHQNTPGLCPFTQGSTILKKACCCVSINQNSPLQWGSPSIKPHFPNHRCPLEWV